MCRVYIYNTYIIGQSLVSLEGGSTLKPLAAVQLGEANVRSLSPPADPQFSWTNSCITASPKPEKTPQGFNYRFQHVRPGQPLLNRLFRLPLTCKRVLVASPTSDRRYQVPEHGTATFTVTMTCMKATLTAANNYRYILIGDCALECSDRRRVRHMVLVKGRPTRATPQVASRPTGRSAWPSQPPIRTRTTTTRMSRSMTPTTLGDGRTWVARVGSSS